MKKFMLLYRGPATDMSAMSDEETQAEMQKWGAWMEGLGDALVDGGNPTGASANLADDGSSGTTCDVNGYSVVQAEDVEGAKALLEGHPHFSEGQGNYSIDVFEIVPVGDAQ